MSGITGVRLHRGKMPRQHPPDMVAVHYYQLLKPMLSQMLRIALHEIKPQLEGWERHAGTYRGDSAGSEAKKLFETLAGQFFREFDNRELAHIPNRVGRQLSEYQKGQLAKQIRSQLSVDVVKDEPWLESQISDFVAENVALIKTVPQKFFSEIEALTIRGISYGERPDKIAKDIQQRYGVAEFNAKRIAKDQSNKFFGRLNSIRQKSLGIEKFVWRTAEDERVRPEHEELDGETFPWTEPPSEGLPGQPVLCRCEGEPDFSGIVEALSD